MLSLSLPPFPFQVDDETDQDYERCDYGEEIVGEGCDGSSRSCVSAWPISTVDDNLEPQQVGS